MSSDAASQGLRRLVLRRPDWMTDEDAAEITRRVHMALSEVGNVRGDPEPYTDRRGGPNAYLKGIHDLESFDRARVLAISSMGFDLDDFVAEGPRAERGVK